MTQMEVQPSLPLLAKGEPGRKAARIGHTWSGAPGALGSTGRNLISNIASLALHIVPGCRWSEGPRRRASDGSI
jgi:hypothetical protein